MFFRNFFALVTFQSYAQLTYREFIKEGSCKTV